MQTIRSNWCRLRGLSLASLLAVTNVVTAADSGDWTYWRGPQMNGVSTAKNLPDDWDPAGGDGSNVGQSILAGNFHELFRRRRDRPI